VASDDSAPEILSQATRLLQITTPALLFLALFAVASSLLYSLRRFTLPAFAAAVFNLTIVIVTAVFAEEIGITAAAFGWLLGAGVQLGMQWFGLRDTHLRLRPVFWHPGIRTIALLYAPVMFSLALDVLINRPFSYNLASGTGEGSISYMEWATTLMQFPHGLVATAISVAVLPTLSRQASEDVQLSAFKDTLALGLRLTLTLIIPATIGLMVLATPVVALIFEHGAFNAHDTSMTALALRLYLVGLPFASVDLLLVFAFYARQDTITPALIGLLSLVAYMVTAIYLLPYYSFFALMIADSIKHLVHSGVSGWLLLRRINGMPDKQLVQTGARALFAAGIMGGVGYVFLDILNPILSGGTLVEELLIVTLVGGTSGILYLALAHWLGIKEISWFFKSLRQRL